MIGKNQDVLPIKLFEVYNKQLNQVETWKQKEPSVELIYVDYKDVLNETDQMIQKINSFVGIDLDTKAMATCVDHSLYRNKV